MDKSNELAQIDKLIEKMKEITDGNRSKAENGQEKTPDKMQPIPLLQSPTFIPKETQPKK